MIGFWNSHVPDPVAFTVFGADIMWYGVMIGVGVLLAATAAYRRAPLHEIPPDRAVDMMIICLPVGIIGARAYYVLFNWADYSGDLMRIVNIRLGGLAVHGGLIAGFLMCLFICRLRRTGALNVFDLFAPCIALGQSIGRWGNYFNSEAHGGPTSLPWGIPVGEQLVHPTFLYESVWCLLIFFVLVAIDNRRAFEGQTFLSYGALYSIERFFVEALRTDSLRLGIFKQAQVLSAAVFIVCIAALIMLRRNTRDRGRIYFGRRV